jgi:hypothetical protein
VPVVRIKHRPDLFQSLGGAIVQVGRAGGDVIQLRHVDQRRPVGGLPGPDIHHAQVGVVRTVVAHDALVVVIDRRAFLGERARENGEATLLLRGQLAVFPAVPVGPGRNRFDKTDEVG